MNLLVDLDPIGWREAEYSGWKIVDHVFGRRTSVGQVLVSCPGHAFHYPNESRLPESIEWKSEIRISKPETSPSSKMIKIRNVFTTFENLTFGLVSDFGFRASNFARGPFSGNVERNLGILRYL